MGFLNGRYKEPGASVPPLTPTAAQSEAQSHSNNIEHTKAVVPIRTTGGAELARFMPVMDIEQAKARRDAIVALMQGVMKDGVDYGKIPGSDKPCLLKPGAEKLCNHFGLVVQFEFMEKVEDWGGAEHGGEPFFYYQIKARVYRDDFLMGEGVGACTSWEAKYRWRSSDRACPQCGQATIRKSKKDPEWYCWQKIGGCGATFSLDDPAITGQQTGRKPNPDVFDQVNTVLKMAHKRAKIDGTINATSASEFFTQDIEDFTVDDPIDTGGHPQGTRQAAQYVAEQKIAGQQPPVRQVPWKTLREMRDAFERAYNQVGEPAWKEELERWGWQSFQDIKAAFDSRQSNAKEKVSECYWHLDAIARKGGR